MRCCVPFCKNTSDNVTTSEGKRISFHGFPSDGSLRAAWLSALGMQDTQLPQSTVVCSRHFLTDDICETERGCRQLVAGAVPSTVQVCMICLDTDSKLFPMSKHKLDEAYEQLTGHPPCEQGNLKQTLCVQCARRLINCSRFRDKSLRARELMLDLINKHELITQQHINMIDRTKNQLKSNIGWSTLGPNPCDLHILEHCSEDKQTEAQETEHRGVVKSEACDDSMSVDGDDSNPDNVFEELVAFNKKWLSEESIRCEKLLLNEGLEGKAAAEQVAETQGPVKCESAPFQCTLCSAEFLYLHTYMQHMCKHLQSAADEGACDASPMCRPRAAESSACDPSLSSQDITDQLSIHKQSNEPRSADLPPTVVAPLSARLATNNANKVHATEQADTIAERERVPETSDGELPVNSCVTNTNTDTLTNCLVQLYDCTKFKEAVPRRDTSLTKTQQAASSCKYKNIDTVSEICKDYQTTSHNVVPATEKIKPVTNEVRVKKCNVSKSLQCETVSSNNSVDLQTNNATENNFLENKSFTCDVCQSVFKQKSVLVKHMKTHNEVKYKCKSVTQVRSHTGEKPYSCSLCEFKTAYSNSLVKHKRTHTGEKPYSCEFCNYKCSSSSSLVVHIRTHTGEKPYSCEFCNYKCSSSSSLVVHIRIHTGEKPYSCKLCNYKSVQKKHLVQHMSTHTGEKPYTCKLCNYKCSRSNYLVRHMSTHTGEKPYTCKLCNYKCSRSNCLVRHMSTHTGENRHIRNRHIRSHTGEKPFVTCQLCSYKCRKNCQLVRHMRTHTGEKPFSCKFCNFKCSSSSYLVVHTRIHTGEKPFSCKFCSYRSSSNCGLLVHSRVHTGEKPYSCKLCDFKSAAMGGLVNHMRSHTGERPYNCKLCNYKITKKSSFVKHMESHSGEKACSSNKL